MTNDDTLYKIALGRIIGSLRERHGYSQRQFASLIGVSAPTLSRIERGTSVPDAITLRRIAGALGLSIDELNAKVDRAIQKTREAGRSVQGSNFMEVLGAVALTGLVMFAVAVIVDEVDSRRR
jgi:transcriptional regulator with XRE-family HTH domain